MKNNKLLNAIIIKKLADQDKLLTMRLSDIEKQVDDLVFDSFQDLEAGNKLQELLDSLAIENGQKLGLTIKDLASEFNSVMSDITGKAKAELIKSYEESIKAIPKPKDGEDGKDYIITQRDFKKIAKLVDVKVPELKEKSPEELRDMMESLKGDNRLDFKAIRGLDEKIKSLGSVEGKGNQTIGRRLTRLSQLKDVSVDGVADGQALIYNKSQEQWIPGAGGGGTITGTDTHVLFFDGDDNPTGEADLTWDKTNNRLKVHDAYLMGVAGDFDGWLAYTNKNTASYPDYTTVMGMNALFSGPTGKGNTAFGNAALATASSGAHNSAFGYGAGGSTSLTGSYNVFIGRNADVDASGPAVSSSIAIGANSEIDSDNLLVIGADNANGEITDMKLGVNTTQTNGMLRYQQGIGMTCASDGLTNNRIRIEGATDYDLVSTATDTFQIKQGSTVKQQINSNGSIDLKDDVSIEGNVEVQGHSYADEEVTASASLDWTEGNHQYLLVKGTTTLTFTDPDGPTTMTLRTVVDPAGGTLTLPTIKWSGGAPTPSTTVGAEDLYSLYFDGTDYIGGYLLDVQ